MRWLVVSLGVIGMTGGIYLGLEPRLRRPVLRVALDLRPSNAEDEALAAGVALALDERDERAGRFRIKTAHQIRPPGGPVHIPEPRAHTMMHSLEGLPAFRAEGDERTLVRVDVPRESETILAWMRERGLTRLESASILNLLSYQSRWQFREAEGPVELPDPISDWLQSACPDVVLFKPSWFSPSCPKLLKDAGFQGPVFVAGVDASALPALEGCYAVLAPLRPAPPDFLRRHPHPFAYVGYRGTLRYLDALDADLQADPLALARSLGPSSAFDDLREEPRVYEIKDGRLRPSRSF